MGGVVIRIDGLDGFERVIIFNRVRGWGRRETQYVCVTFAGAELVVFPLHICTELVQVKNTPHRRRTVLRVQFCEQARV